MKKLVILLVLLLSGAVTAAAQEVELSTVVETLQVPFRQTTASAGQIRDFVADFVQLSAIAAIDRVQRGEGQVRFKFQARADRPDRLPGFRWDYREPEVQHIISNGATLWVYVPDNRQVIISDVSRVQADYGDSPAALFGSLGRLGENFHIEWGRKRQDDQGHYHLVLTPLRDSRLIRQIEVVVNREAVFAWQQERLSATVFPLIETLVTDPQDNLTRITFIDPRWNQSPADSLFEFEVPPGVEELSPVSGMPF